jgi:hypothetical protein
MQPSFPSVKYLYSTLQLLKATIRPYIDRKGPVHDRLEALSFSDPLDSTSPLRPNSIFSAHAIAILCSYHAMSFKVEKIGHDLCNFPLPSLNVGTWSKVSSLPQLGSSVQSRIVSDSTQKLRAFGCIQMGRFLLLSLFSLSFLFPLSRSCINLDETNRLTTSLRTSTRIGRLCTTSSCHRRTSFTPTS